ncbi:MAG: hypothetical protein AABZ44_06250 [Elusimicrobiota bacterium]
MLLKEFRDTLFEHLLTFLWKQWTALGVLGTTGSEDNWIIDPEPLLIFSLEMGRYEPRLFDEILGWLWTNGQLVDTTRLRNLLSTSNDLQSLRLIGGSLGYLGHVIPQRKWHGLSSYCLKEFQAVVKNKTSPYPIEPLFKEKNGNPYPLETETPSDAFLDFYLNKRDTEWLRQTPPVPINAQAGLRFFLRSFFGVGARSECILYLLTHEGGHPSEIAPATGFSWLAIRQALEGLLNSGLVQSRMTGSGKRLEYWLSHARWWDFLAYSGQNETQKAKWVDWIAICPALSQTWRSIDGLAQGKESDYMRNSKLQDALEVLHREFIRAGLDLPPLPNLSVPSDAYLKSALGVLTRIFNIPVIAGENK